MGREVACPGLKTLGAIVCEGIKQKFLCLVFKGPSQLDIFELVVIS